MIRSEAMYFEESLPNASVFVEGVIQSSAWAMYIRWPFWDGLVTLGQRISDLHTFVEGLDDVFHELEDDTWYARVLHVLTMYGILL